MHTVRRQVYHIKNRSLSYLSIMNRKEMGNFTGVAFMTIYMNNSIDRIIMVKD